MSRQGWKKRAGGVKAPPELLDLCRSVFFALSYDEQTIEAAMERAVREASTPTRSAVKRYLTHVAEHIGTTPRIRIELGILRRGTPNGSSRGSFGR